MTISGVKIKKADGTWVGGASKPPDVQDFTTSGTWTKPVGAKWVFYEVVSAGAGCPGSPYLGAGGGGGYQAALVSADVLGATESVTIGAGTTGAGGSSSFAAITVTGGGPAPSGNNWGGAGGGLAGGAGGRTDGVGSPSGGQSGIGGGGGSVQTTTSATGGSSYFGAGGGGRSSGGLGGTKSIEFGRLKPGNGGGYNQNGIAPGGGCGPTSGTALSGAPGAVRITTYF